MSDAAKRRCMDSEGEARRVESVRAAHKRPEIRAKVLAANFEINTRTEVKAMRADSLRSQWEDPDQRARRLESLAKPEVKAAISDSAKATWSDPDKAAKMRAAQKAGWADPDKKAAALKSRREMWADPVKRAEMIEKQKASWVKRKTNAAQI